MKQISYTKNNSNITIKIPIDLLKVIAETHPTDPVWVLDKQIFADRVLFQLENWLGSSDSGLTGFQELLDKAIYEVGCQGEEFVCELKEI